MKHSPRSPAGIAAVSALLLATASPAAAQTPLWTFDGSVPEGRSGSGLACAGDVDADGHDDVIVGSPTDPTTGFAAGSARVYSGADGSLLHEIFGTDGFDLFGSSVAGCGDVDRDGHDDFVVGAPLALSVGSATVYSGADGSVLHTFLGGNFEDDFGRAVDGAGDVDRDGYPDVVVGASWDKTSFGFGGAVYVYSGADGSVLHRFLGKGSFHFLGRFVAGVGDVNGDGFADVAGGADRASISASESGAVRVWSGADGSELHEFLGDATGDAMAPVGGAGDVNGDGFDDVIVGAYTNDAGGEDAGVARVHSGADGSVLYEVIGEEPGDWTGISVDGAGDVNGDGYADFAVGSSDGIGFSTDPGRVRVYSGMDGSVLVDLEGDAPGDAFGLRVAAGGDVDGDGLGDVLVGAPHADPGGDESGTVVALAFDGPFGPWRELEGELAGSFLAPELRGRGLLQGGDPVTLELSYAPPSTLGLLFLGLAAANVPHLGGTIVPDVAPPGFVSVFPTDAAGSWRFDGLWPGATSGDPLFLQFWIYDAGAPDQVCASNAVSATAP